jgi:hypothetical protein
VEASVTAFGSSRSPLYDSGKMDKQYILDEIRRTSANGKAVGQTRFETATGVKQHHWRGVYWANWGEAVRDAGFEPNDWTGAHDEAFVFECLAYLTRKLAKYPTKSEMDLERRRDPKFPHSKSIFRLGSKSELLAALQRYCESNDEFHDILGLLPISPLPTADSHRDVVETSASEGYVYLVSAQGAYKIGSTRAPYRRVAELVNQSAHGAELLHKIPTDDPEGIERYWHDRFADKRISGINKRSGEWFQLSRDDIKAFKRRKGFM